MATNKAPELAAEFGRVLARYGGSIHNLHRRTRISRETLTKLSDGAPAALEAVERFARATGEDVNHWRRLAGYEPVVPDELREVQELIDAARRFLNRHDPTGADEALAKLTHAGDLLEVTRRKAGLEPYSRTDAEIGPRYFDAKLAALEAELGYTLTTSAEDQHLLTASCQEIDHAIAAIRRRELERQRETN